MAVSVIDILTYKRERTRQSDPDEAYVRNEIRRQLRRLVSAVRSANAEAEGVRRLRLHWPKEQAVAHAVAWALGPSEPPTAA